MAFHDVQDETYTYTEEEVQDLICRITRHFELGDEEVPELAKIFGVPVVKREYEAILEARIRVKAWHEESAQDMLSEFESDIGRALDLINHESNDFTVLGWVVKLD